MLTNDGIYTSEMIENMTSEKQVEDAVYVASTYLSRFYKVLEEHEKYKLVIFPEFKEVDGNYEWVYEENDNYYCISLDERLISKMENEKCSKIEPFKIDEKWCGLYKNSTLVYDDDVANLCKEQ